MNIRIHEIKSDSALIESGIYIDIILTENEVDALSEGELLESHGGLQNKKFNFGIGLQGFYGQDRESEEEND